MKHIEFEKLIGRFEETLAAGEAAAVNTHLEDCGACSVDAKKLADLFAYVEPVATETVSQAVTAHLLNIYQPGKFRSATPSTAPLGRFTLIFDDWQTVMNERFRGSFRRQMLYNAGDYDLDLRMMFDDDNCVLTGQVLPDLSEGTIELSAGGKTLTAVLNVRSEFQFASVPQGIYDLRLQLDDIELWVEGVPLRS